MTNDEDADWWINELTEELLRQRVLMGTPHRVSRDDEVSFEWWNGDKKLTVSMTWPRDTRTVQMLWSWKNERGGSSINSIDDGVNPEIAALAYGWLMGKGPVDFIVEQAKIECAAIKRLTAERDEARRIAREFRGIGVSVATGGDLNVEGGNPDWLAKP